MKIGLIGPVYPYRGGIAHFTTLLGKKLIEAGHEVRVISFKKQYPAWLYPGESDKDHSPGRVKVAADYVLTPLNPLSWWKTVRALGDFHPQQVILPWWVTFWGPAFQCVIAGLKRRGIPVTVLIHNTMPHEARLMDRFLARRTLQRADRYIVMTEKEKNRLLALLPDVERISIVPHPIYQMFSPSMFDQKTMRETLGLPVEKPILLFFGFIRPYKGLAVLLEALQLVNNQGQEIHLIVAGEFWDNRKIYEQLIDRYGLSNLVHIFDSYIPDDEVSQYFTASDLFVAPYIGGTQSGALKIAIGFGVPCVVTDVIADEIVEMFHELCYIATTNDAESLAFSIKQALNVPKQSFSNITPVFDQTWKLLIEDIINT
ncbi:MAG: glycosyltransferase [Brevefilum sp.]|nr:glycosyltransferase [Brevefilum sp.]